MKMLMLVTTVLLVNGCRSPEVTSQREEPGAIICWSAGASPERENLAVIECVSGPVTLQTIDDKWEHIGSTSKIVGNERVSTRNTWFFVPSGSHKLKLTYTNLDSKLTPSGYVNQIQRGEPIVIERELVAGHYYTVSGSTGFSTAIASATHGREYIGWKAAVYDQGTLSEWLKKRPPNEKTAFEALWAGPRMGSGR